MDRLSMPHGSTWARIGVLRAVSKAEPETLLVIKAAASAELTFDNMTTPTTALAEWAGFAFDMFGRIVPAIQPGRPHWRFEGRPDLFIEVWYAHIFTDDRQSQVQGIWSPRLGICKAVTAAGPTWAGRPLKRATAAMGILEAFERSTRGRPEIYGEANEPQFFAELDKAAHAAVRDGERLSWASLERHGSVGWRTFRDAVQQFGYDLAAIDAEANRCNRGRGQNICRFLVGRRAEFKRKGA